MVPQDSKSDLPLVHTQSPKPILCIANKNEEREEGEGDQRG